MNKYEPQYVVQEFPPPLSAATSVITLIKLHKRKEKIWPHLHPLGKNKCGEGAEGGNEERVRERCRKQGVLAITLQFFFKCLSFDCSAVERLLEHMRSKLRKREEAGELELYK